MVYAATEDQYNEANASLKGICNRCGLEGFYEYFLKNWDSSRERWVYFLRAKLPHFSNHTNKRLEAFFGKLKEGVDGSMSMAMCVKALIAYDRRKQNEYEYRLARIGQFVNSNYDEEMQNILRFTTHFVAQHIERQYAAGVAKSERYNCEEDGQDARVVLVRGLFQEHRLRVDDWSCDCDFVASMCLPCRHAIAYRKHVGFRGPLIPWSRIDQRWTTSTQKLKKVKQFVYERFSSSVVGSTAAKVRTHSDRYREAVRATHLIANEMADIEDDAEFDDMLEFVMNQWRNVRQRKMADQTEVCTPTQRKVVSANASLSVMGDAVVRKEFEISSSSDDESSYDHYGDGNTYRKDDNADKDVIAAGSHVPIRLNPNAEKAAEAGRKTAGEVTLLALIETLNRERPGLVETQRRLSGHAKAEKKKPKLKLLKNPVLIQDPFYLLPSKLLDACLKVLPVSNTPENAISIEEDQDARVTSPDKAVMPRNVETVAVKDVGNFTRKQIDTFKRIQNLKDAVQMGLDLLKWLTEEAIPTLPAEYHELAQKIANEVLTTYPYQRIPDMPNQFALLYRAIPPTWLNDGAIRALCWRLSQDYPNCRFAGFQSAVPKTKRTRNKDDGAVDKVVREHVLAQIANDGVDTVLLPLIFDNFHWCCVTVKGDPSESISTIP
ncbi:hypothetical protein PPTG_06342 [Phytophthora nicotianae INRA-310]|uniref:SWIM-type domain-containing protein n=1 Tax=Phytophthora nicotianae (strain INRA-310) TaxID=761204 RepID=W2QT23_PHYN3|nr:hypothetical protein PPTG_06342 [Phytophthora nicotianae INRA-310]ETN16126.1 hypothetical protein PPTG_06342 [Phytophthora nicotianae INRA-310]